VLCVGDPFCLNAFRMWSENALVMLIPSCWIVNIVGVGEEYEYPKNCRDLFLFQLASAVLSIPIGAGVVVALRNMVAACGLFGGNL
jgi:hypothetical protein